MRKISEKITLDNGHKKIFEAIYENEKGVQRSIYTLANSGSSEENIVVLILTQEGKIVLNKEFRFGPEKYIVGVPTGKIDLGESPVDAMIREVHEETGHNVLKYVSLGKFIDNPYTTGINHFFLALTDVGSKKIHVDFEDIENLTIPYQVLEEMILDGSIECSFTPAIYFLAKAKTNNFSNFDL